MKRRFAGTARAVLKLLTRELRCAGRSVPHPAHRSWRNHGDPRHGLGDPIVADESVVAWTWPDGDVGIGNYERSERFSTIPNTQIPLPAGSPFRAGRRGHDK
jgi:hypothetical protein